MLRPSTLCKVFKVLPDYDEYGQNRHGRERTTRCAVVHLAVGETKTSVRADSSASRGQAREQTSDATLLFLPHEDVGLGDKVEVAGIALRIISKAPRFCTDGRIAHIEVECSVWA